MTNTKLVNINATTTAIGAKTYAIETAQARVATKLEHAQSTLDSVSDQLLCIGDNAQSSHFEIIGRLDANQMFNQMQVKRQEERFLEIYKMLQTLQNQTSSYESETSDIKFASMMAAKPALLKETSDAANFHSGTQRGHSIEANGRSSQVLRSCSCQRRRRVTRKSSSWALFSTFEESIMESKHKEGCPFSQPSTSTHQRRIGVLFTGLHQYLSTAISMSLCMTSGAGGSSISPTFRYFPMVDREKSPAFRMVRSLIMMLYMKAGTRTWAEVLQRMDREFDLIDMDILDLAALQSLTFSKILDVGISKLREIFKSGVASPTDVDEYGNTAIHGVTLQVSQFYLCPKDLLSM